MANRISLSEIRMRVESVATSVKDRAIRLAGSKSVTTGEEQKAKGLHARADTLRRKLPQDEGSTWDAVASEVERDLKALEGDFDHWIRYIDRHFEEQGGAG